MYTKRHFYLVGFLLIVTLGCGFLGGEEPPTATPERVKIDPLVTAKAQDNTEKVEPTATILVASPLPSGVSLTSGLDELASYRANLSLKQNDGMINIINETMNSSGNSHLTVESAGIKVGNLSETSNTEVYVLNGTVYLRYAPVEPWLWLPEAEKGRIYVPDATAIAEVAGSLPVEGIRNAAPEQVNGVMAERYNFTEEERKGAIWVAVDTPVIIKIEMVSTNDDSLRLNYNLISELDSFVLPTDLENAMALLPDAPTPEPFTLEVSENLSNQIPIMVDAEELSVTNSTADYITTSPLNDVGNFYYNELEAAGWKVDPNLNDTDESRITTGYSKEGYYMTVQGELNVDGVVAISVVVEQQ
ncbi:hypothetical protein QUF58_00940 [Anaerolineales bacterium HSG24]|nr:hypothetical protein [Anaerolineales bacterium HSG24]